MTDLLLLPTPQKLETTGGEVATAGLAISETIDPAAVRLPGDEAYRLVVTASGAKLTARTAAGLRAGRATLAQLMTHARIPQLAIDDAPRFAHRGVMLDISRDRVPTMATLFRLVEQLASWKMNHLQLYTEHTVAYRGHEEVWRAASPITLEELTALDAHCTAHGIALTANQNCLGHVERWLRHPAYAHLGEVSEPWLKEASWYVEPNTLIPSDPAGLALIGDLLGQLLPRCSGVYVNIGCDEPWDLGTGRSKEVCARLGTKKVFSQHVSAVAAIARKLGKRPQFWCDPHPNEDDGLPQDMVALVWGYDDDTDFATRVRSHRAAGREVWVAPGTGCWNSSTGRTWVRRSNLDHAAAEGEAVGFLSTAWGDGGHRQQWPITLMGFADSAQAAWHGAGGYDDRAAGLRAFGDPAVGVWLARLGDVDVEMFRGQRPDFTGRPGSRLWNNNPLWLELGAKLFDRWGPGDTAAWQEVDGRLTALEAELPATADPLLCRELVHATAIARWTCARAIERRRPDGMRTDERKALAARMAALLGEHRRLWLARSRYGGLEDSCVHYRQHAAQW